MPLPAGLPDCADMPVGTAPGRSPRRSGAAPARLPGEVGQTFGTLCVVSQVPSVVSVPGPPSQLS